MSKVHPPLPLDVSTIEDDVVVPNYDEESDDSMESFGDFDFEVQSDTEDPCENLQSMRTREKLETGRQKKKKEKKKYVADVTEVADVKDAIKEKAGGKRRRKEEEEPERIKFAEEICGEEMTFLSMKLPRQLMVGLSRMGFHTPTPIQAAVYRRAMEGRDICAGAVTGSGKTLAFMLPVLHRLVFRPTEPATRALVLEPTRELAVQVYEVAAQLAAATNIVISLVTGGLDVSGQAALLKRTPDVVIATPGRLLDHVVNTANFDLNRVEILVLDEADRMLDAGFKDEMTEIMQRCKSQHQTMLFSATMTDEVEVLAGVSLKEPVKVAVDTNTATVDTLVQEFVRIRPARESWREAVIAALVSRTFHSRVMVFVPTKVLAHRLKIVLGLLGINVGELHSSLSQTQRLETLKQFKERDIDVLLATDIAGRGLDIQGVKTVINYSAPNTYQQYIHRVGRTARAGKHGRSVTLVGEGERNILKSIVKNYKGKDPLRNRVIPSEVLEKLKARLDKLETEVARVLEEERQEKQIRAIENQTNKAQRLLESNGGEAAPKRGWFQSQRERKQSKAQMKKAFKEQMEAKNQEKKDPVRTFKASKKAFRAERLRACEERRGAGGQGKAGAGPRGKKRKTFDEELTSTSRQALKKFRAGPSFQERKELGLAGRRKQKGKKR